MAATHDGRYLLWTVNEGGRTRPYLRDLLTGTDLPLPPRAGSGVLETFSLSPDGRCLAFRIASATTAGDIYTHNVGTGETCRLTYSMLGGIREADLVEPELVRFPTFDREIPAWLYRPRNLSDGQRVPVVLSLHGGPEVQEKPTFNAIYQYLLDQGVAVLAPNMRGSTGYGKSYQKLMARNWGSDDLHDLKACARIPAQPALGRLQPHWPARRQLRRLCHPAGAYPAARILGLRSWRGRPSPTPTTCAPRS